MLGKYADRFAALPPEASARLWAACVDRYPTRMSAPNGGGTGGAALLAACSAAGLFQAEVVMAVADARDPPALAALEVFVGHPVTYARPTDPRPGARCTYPACGCTRRDGPNETAPCPLGLPAPPARAEAEDGPPQAIMRSAPAGKRPRRQITRRDPRPVLRVAPNPRKEGTAAHAGYACWRAGDTVDECIARGLPRRYVRKDTARGRVDLGPVPR